MLQVLIVELLVRVDFVVMKRLVQTKAELVFLIVQHGEESLARLVRVCQRLKQKCCLVVVVEPRVAPFGVLKSCAACVARHHRACVGRL